ncbi:C1 family peptidase [uncultured Microscilla sp.]|uniref:C1 family peptidase n=1 Tax=uncultured Microscilla sp. TaxID=432653 RepID=UPI0026348995|nr:C1 family peptidase [uncultured Microscilla sp.]
MKLKYALFLVVIGFISPNTPYAQQFDYGLGVKIDEEGYNKVKLAHVSRGDFKALPGKVSLKKYCPTPGNQGKTGTCVAWSSTYGARTIIYAMEHGITNPKKINNIAFSPSFIYNQIREKGDKLCKSGTYVYDAMYKLKKQGAMPLKDFAFDCNRMPQPADKAKASKYRIKDYQRLFFSSAKNKVAMVKKSIAEGNPVVVAMKIGFTFTYAKKVYRDPAPANARRGGHAMVVVGYDDKKQAFELMNSWGTKWGDGGFVYYHYDSFQKYCAQAYEMIPSSPVLISDDMLGKDIPKATISGTVVFKQYLKEAEVFKDMRATKVGNSYQMLNAYTEGDSFQMVITNNQRIHVYALNFDGTNKCFKLFPFAGDVLEAYHQQARGTKISSIKNHKRAKTIIPHEDNVIELDDTKGLDYFCVLFARKSLNIDRIMLAIEKATGTFEQRLSKALGNQAALPKEIKMEQSMINFKAKTSKVIVPVVVRMRHQ